ncbi:hypothetical protein [Amycolatopsis sp. YIM 10]|uniref:hypothetical protein n=1 Tax=Amycolatopsis sp. YIM 10 TaxID=2653857 RepID=UPI0018834445|nr:hypothetical protein [Amycolatopsis sp. YIM 10]
MAGRAADRHQVHPGPRALQGRPDPAAHPAHQVRRDHQDLPVHLGLRPHRVRQAHRDHAVPRDHQVHRQGLPDASAAGRADGRRAEVVANPEAAPEVQVDVEEW